MLTITSNTRRGKNRKIEQESMNQPIDVLSDIINWSDLRIHDVSNPEKVEEPTQSFLELQQHFETEKNEDEVIKDPTSASVTVHELLDKIVKNIRYGDNDNETYPFKGAYETLDKIITKDQNDDKRFDPTEITYKGEMAKVTYMVLDKIINNKQYSEKYKPLNFVRNVNRLSRSIKSGRDESTPDVEKLNEHQIPLSKILPTEILENEVVVRAIQESIEVLSQEFTDPTLATQEEIDNLVSKIRSIQEVTEITTHETDFKFGLINWLKDISTFIDNLIQDTPDSGASTGDDSTTVFNTRSTGSKPVILIDGGELLFFTMQ